MSDGLNIRVRDNTESYVGLRNKRIGNSDTVRVFIQRPSEALHPFIKRFVVLEFSSAHRDSHLPDPGLVAAFCFKGQCILHGEIKAPEAGLVGLWDRARSHEHSANSGVVLAVFTATGAAALLRQPLDELLNGTFALDEILGSSGKVRRVHEQVDEAQNHARRIEAVENFLLARLPNARPDIFVSAAVAKIEEAQGILRIDQLARCVGLSQSALERRFRSVAGASPKTFASIVRLRRVLRLRKKGADFTSIAIEAGYCDQSHFIKDFKQITGFAPQSFFGRKLSPWFDDVAHATLT
jgi:AraC-like DNA-binding protein